MPDAEPALAELKVSGHLMRLEPGLFCIVQTASAAADPATGLPGVRISAAPSPAAAGSLEISSFRADGWLAGTGDAALVRVGGHARHVMVTIYQAAGATGGAPSLQVVRLLEGEPAIAAPLAHSAEPAVPVELVEPVAPVDLVAHLQTCGDTGGHLGRWLGTPGSRLWIEGFALAPAEGVAADDIEYQVVLGRGWSSPWVEGGQFCGSRGMALPILGFRIRLRGPAAASLACSYAARFVDGTGCGPVGDGEPCETPGLAAVEAMIVAIHAPGQRPPMDPPASPQTAAQARPARWRA